jgi:hypothetical protein
MTEPLYSLAYFSRNAIAGDPDAVRAQIAAILRTARRHNAEIGVTGALLYSDGCFAQVLEGQREAVEDVFESIQCDTRHCDVTVLHLHPVSERSFGAWSMAFGGIAGNTQPAAADAGMTAADDILATPAGQNLLAALRSVVYRDDLALHAERRGG